MIYLASPYSHHDPAIREARFQSVCRAAAALIRAGHAVFSPIAHSHSIAAFGLPTDWAYWQAQMRHHLETSAEVVVLTLDGWQQSVGIAAEVAIAGELDKPVRFLAPDDLPEA